MATIRPDRAAIRLDPRRRIHVTEAYLQQREDLPIHFIDAGTNVGHGGALGGIEGGAHPKPHASLVSTLQSLTFAAPPARRAPSQLTPHVR